MISEPVFTGAAVGPVSGSSPAAVSSGGSSTAWVTGVGVTGNTGSETATVYPPGKATRQKQLVQARHRFLFQVRHSRHIRKKKP